MLLVVMGSIGARAAGMWRLLAVGLLLSASLLGGCGPVAPRDWIIRFAPGDAALERNLSRPGVEDDWERIGTRIVSGTVCGASHPRTESEVPGPDGRGYDLRQLVLRGEMPESMRMELAPGDYTVMAWAIDENEALYAWSCLAVGSPGAGPIISELRSVPSPVALRAEWRVAFESAATEALASRVFVRAEPGTCPTSPPTRQPSDRLVTIPPGGYWAEPLTLTSGAPTAFMAWAENDAGCSIAAYGCVDGPGPPVIETRMRALSPAPSFCGDPRACRGLADGLACDHLVVEEIAVGHTSSCYRSTESEVFCEGSIAGSPMVMPSGFVPERLFTRHARRSSSPGSLDRGDGYCAIDATRTLVCWGDAFPFVDIAVTEPQRIASSTLPSGPGLPLVVSMGLRVGCVVMATDATGGTVYCRGIDGDPSRDDLVGSGDVGPWVLAPAPSGVGNDIAILEGGAMATCASNYERTYCWGDERADVAMPDYSLSMPLQFSTSQRFEVVGAGEMHACGLADDGLVQCWGSDFSGQLEPRFEIGTLPAACTGLDYYQMVERPDCAGYALNDLYDSVHGPRGVRGSYDEAFAAEPDFPPRSPPAACPRAQGVDRAAYLDCVLELDGEPLVVSDLAVGAFHTCAISASAVPLHEGDEPGRVLCWGDDYADQIGGRGETSGRFTHGNAAWVRPCDGTEPSTTAFLGGAVDIAAGTNRTCAIDGRGDVLCWGSGVGAATSCAERPAGLPLVR